MWVCEEVRRTTRKLAQLQREDWRVCCKMQSTWLDKPSSSLLLVGGDRLTRQKEKKRMLGRLTLCAQVGSWCLKRLLLKMS